MISIPIPNTRSLPKLSSVLIEIFIDLIINSKKMIINARNCADKLGLKFSDTSINDKNKIQLLFTQAVADLCKRKYN